MSIITKEDITKAKVCLNDDNMAESVSRYLVNGTREDGVTEAVAAVIENGSFYIDFHGNLQFFMPSTDDVLIGGRRDSIEIKSVVFPDHCYDFDSGVVMTTRADMSAISTSKIALGEVKDQIIDPFIRWFVDYKK